MSEWTEKICQEESELRFIQPFCPEVSNPFLQAVFKGGFVQPKGTHFPQCCFGRDKIRRQEANVLVIYCCVSNHPKLAGVTQKQPFYHYPWRFWGD